MFGYNSSLVSVGVVVGWPAGSGAGDLITSVCLTRVQRWHQHCRLGCRLPLVEQWSWLLLIKLFQTCFLVLGEIEISAL